MAMDRCARRRGRMLRVRLQIEKRPSRHTVAGGAEFKSVISRERSNSRQGTLEKAGNAPPFTKRFRRPALQLSPSTTGRKRLLSLLSFARMASSDTSRNPVSRSNQSIGGSPDRRGRANSNRSSLASSRSAAIARPQFAAHPAPRGLAECFPIVFRRRSWIGARLETIPGRLRRSGNFRVRAISTTKFGSDCCNIRRRRFTSSPRKFKRTSL